jgi:hypothetical protein
MATVATPKQSSHVDEFAEARALIDQGYTNAALAFGEQARQGALASHSQLELEDVLDLARLAYQRSDQRGDTEQRKRAGRLADAAQHDLRFLWPAPSALTVDVLGVDYPPRKLLIAALGIVLATMIPLLIGAWLDTFSLYAWGAVAAYVGISEVVPGVLVGLAMSCWATGHTRRHPRALGIAAGIVVGFVLLFANVLIIAAPAADA